MPIINKFKTATVAGVVLAAMTGSTLAADHSTNPGDCIAGHVSGVSRVADIIETASRITSSFSFGVQTYPLEKFKNSDDPLGVIEFNADFYSGHRAERIVRLFNEEFGDQTARYATPDDYKSGQVGKDVVAIVIPLRILYDKTCTSRLNKSKMQMQPQ